MPRKFGDMVNVRTNQVLLWVRSVATGLWTAELLFYCTGTSYLASGWRRFCQQHEIVAEHFLIFNYDDDHQITVTVCDNLKFDNKFEVPVMYSTAIPEPLFAIYIT
jgi:hypothetical protein